MRAAWLFIAPSSVRKAHNNECSCVRTDHYLLIINGLLYWNVFGVDFFTELAYIDLDHKQEEGDENGTENEADEPKHADTNDDAENGDHGMNVAELLLEPETEHVVHDADDAEAIDEHDDALSAVAVGEKDKAEGNISHGSADYGQHSGDAGYDEPEYGLVYPY